MAGRISGLFAVEATYEIFEKKLKEFKKFQIFKTKLVEISCRRNSRKTSCVNFIKQKTFEAIHKHISEKNVEWIPNEIAAAFSITFKGITEGMLEIA